MPQNLGRLPVCLALVLCSTSLVSAQQVRYLEGHTDPIYAVVYTPDGSRLLTGSFDRTVKIWDRASGKVLRTLADHQNFVLTVAVSKDGKLFASGGLDNVVKVYDMPTREPIADLGQQPGPVAGLNVSRDGKWLLSGDRGKLVRLWNAENQQHVRDFGQTPAEVMAVEISPNVAFVLAASQDGTLSGWNRENGQTQGAAYFPRINALSIHPDNRTVILGCEDGIARLLAWPPEPQKNFAVDQPIRTISVSFDNNRLVSGAENGILRFYTPADSKETGNANQGAALRSTAFSRDHNTLAAGDVQGNVKFWRPNDAAPLGQLESHTGPVRDLAYHPNNQQLATVGEDGLVKLWQLPLSASRDVAAHPAAIRRFSLSNDGNTLATASDDKNAKLWKAADGTEIKTLGGHTAQVLGVAVLPNNQHAVTVSQDGQLRLFQVGDGKHIGTGTAHTGPVTSVAVHPNSQQAATGGEDGTIRLWKLPLSAGPREHKPHQAAIRSLAISTDGNLLATASDDKNAKILKSADGGEVKNLGGHEGQVWDVTFSANNAQAVTACQDQKVRLFNIGDGNLVKAFEGLGAAAKSAAIHPNGQQIAGGAENNKAMVWKLDGTAEGELAGHGGAVVDMAWLPNGSQIVTAADSHLRFFKPDDRSQIRAINTGTGVTCLAVSRDNQLVAAGGADNHIRIYQVDNGNPVADLTAHGAAITSLAFSGDNQFLSSTSADKTAKLWKVKGPLWELFTLPAAAQTALSNDGKTLFTAGDDGQLRAYTVSVQGVLEGHQGRINALAYHSNSTHLVSAGQDATIRRWIVNDLNNLRQERTYDGLGGPVNDATISRDGNLLAIAGANKRVRVFRFAEAQGVADFEAHTSAVHSVSFSPDNRRLLTTGEDRTAKVWDFAANQLLQQYTLPAAISGGGFTNDNKQVHLSSADGHLRAAPFATLAVIKGHNGPVTSLAYTNNGSHVLTGGQDHTVRLWNIGDVNNIKQERTFDGNGQPVWDVAISPNNALVSACGQDGHLRVE